MRADDLFCAVFVILVFSQIKKVIVASTNPVKINTTEIGFAKLFPEEIFEVVGKSASSVVPDQPIRTDETLKGAIDRTKNFSTNNPGADYWLVSKGGLKK